MQFKDDDNDHQQQVRQPDGNEVFPFERQDLVDAQQARRVLDRIVGYKLSPLLWRKVKPGLSAGRVQSVATRIVVDRENEIRAFQPQEYWLLDALLDCGAGTFSARFYGTADKKMDVPDEATADKIIAAVSAEPFQIASVKRGEKQRNDSLHCNNLLQVCTSYHTIPPRESPRKTAEFTF